MERSPAHQAGEVDLTKVGPWTRKPTKEGQIRKEVAELLKMDEQAMKKGDFEECLSRVDFPVHMVTDDAQGVPSDKLVERPAYEAMMRPFFENRPKDLEISHKPTVTVLSDSLVNVTDDFTMRHGGRKFTGKSAGIAVKRIPLWMTQKISPSDIDWVWGNRKSGAFGYTFFPIGVWPLPSLAWQVAQ